MINNTIKQLTIEAENKYNLVLAAPADLKLKYREVGRAEWSTFHYPTQEQFFVGLLALVETGYASIPVSK